MKTEEVVVSQDGEFIDFVSKSRKRTSHKNESVKRTKKAIDFVPKSDEGLKPLSGKALARRLGVSGTTLLKCGKGEMRYGIQEWTQSRDPEGIAWEFWQETKQYHPVV